MTWAEVNAQYTWGYTGEQYSFVCCANCCGSEHRFLKMHGEPSCLWCELCGHVYAGRCDEHRS